MKELRDYELEWYSSFGIGGWNSIGIYNSLEEANKVRTDLIEGGRPEKLRVISNFT